MYYKIYILLLGTKILVFSEKDNLKYLICVEPALNTIIYFSSQRWIYYCIEFSHAMEFVILVLFTLYFVSHWLGYFLILRENGERNVVNLRNKICQIVLNLTLRGEGGMFECFYFCQFSPYFFFSYLSIRNFSLDGSVWHWMYWIQLNSALIWLIGVSYKNPIWQFNFI